MSAPNNPDFTQGVALADIPDTGVLAGHIGDAPVLLAKVQGRLHAVSGSCTHYGAPLGEGLRVGDEIRCPWHHACFSLCSGSALKAPAFAALTRYKVEVEGERVFVRSEETTPLPTPTAPAKAPARVVIIGGGAAAFACAYRLRERGYQGSLTMLSNDDSAPVDRPNLSKDYLAGSAPEEWMPLQGPDYYAEQKIDLRLNTEVTALDTQERSVAVASGERFPYDALLLATGAEPVRLKLPGFDLPNVYGLRSLGDTRRLIEGLKNAKTVALVGAGFIGMEAASALRARKLDVHVITPEALPLERILGKELAERLVQMHRDNGVHFHLGAQTTAFDGHALTLADGSTLAVDAVLVGIGVRPRTALAERAGLTVDNGIVVDAHLQTVAPGVYAAGDVASYPHGDGRARVEHWVHAERQGQVVAENMLGAHLDYVDPPFFWTHHYGTDLRYSGHGRGWTRVEIDGSPADNDCIARYYKDGALVAAATLGRDRALLALETQLA